MVRLPQGSRRNDAIDRQDSRRVSKVAGDPSVKDAFSAFRRSKKETALLGPSKNLQNVHDTIKNARRNYVPEIAAPKKKPRSSSTPSKATPKKKGQAMKL